MKKNLGQDRIGKSCVTGSFFLHELLRSICGSNLGLPQFPLVEQQFSQGKPGSSPALDVANFVEGNNCLRFHHARFADFSLESQSTSQTGQSNGCLAPVAKTLADVDCFLRGTDRGVVVAEG